MIYKNIKLGGFEKEDVSVANFGNGTIGMASVLYKDNLGGAIFLVEEPKRPLGEEAVITELFSPDMVWSFSSIESIDNVIYQLEHLKRCVKAGKIVEYGKRKNK